MSEQVETFRNLHEKDAPMLVLNNVWDAAGVALVSNPGQEQSLPAAPQYVGPKVIRYPLISCWQWWRIFAGYPFQWILRKGIVQILSACEGTGLAVLAELGMVRISRDPITFLRAFSHFFQSPQAELSGPLSFDQVNNWFKPSGCSLIFR